MSDDPGETTDPQAILPFDDGSAGRVIRKEWYDGRWFFSVIDAVAALTDSETPRRYWSDLKRKLQDDEGFDQLYAKIVQLKMRSPLDGKKYKTDAADTENHATHCAEHPQPEGGTVQAMAGAGGRAESGGTGRNQRRLFLREEIADKNRSLADTVTNAGIVTSRDFAIFQDFGYKGLYNGETARDIAARKGLAHGQRILDHMVSEEMAANWFRITQAEAKMRRDGVDNKADANRTHYAVGKKVRETIADLGGTMPEELPTPEQSIQQLERAEQQRIAARRQPTLFPTALDQ